MGWIDVSGLFNDERFNKMMALEGGAEAFQMYLFMIIHKIISFDPQNAERIMETISEGTSAPIEDVKKSMENLSSVGFVVLEWGKNNKTVRLADLGKIKQV